MFDALDRRIVRLRSQGLSVRKIASKVGVGKSTVARRIVALREEWEVIRNRR
jgi:transposase